MHGRHLTIEDREVIGKMSAQGRSRTAIAVALECDRTSVGRELQRNARSDGDYFPNQAQALADERRRRSKSPWKMERPGIAAYVWDKIQQYWSPQQIAGRMELDYPGDPTMRIADRQAAMFNAGKLRAVTRHPGLPHRTMTTGNGKEFAAFGILQKRLWLDVYFADPYHSWQRGTNENTNGLLRQFFPKRLDLRGVTHRYVAYVERLLNPAFPRWNSDMVTTNTHLKP